MYCMIVKMGFCAPRTWSCSLIFGKTDGSSGPGVGAVTRLVQEAGVGMMILIVGVVLTGTEAVAGGGWVQADRKRKKKKKREESFRIGFLDSSPPMNCATQRLKPNLLVLNGLL